MTDGNTYKEIKFPKGAAKGLYEALTAANDMNAPDRKKKPATVKKTPAKKPSKK
jgi:hypothetical protein